VIAGGPEIMLVEGDLGERGFDLHVRDAAAPSKGTTAYQLTNFVRIEDSAIVMGMIALLTRERAWGKPEQFLANHPNLVTDAIAASVAVEVREARRWLDLRLEALKHKT
jgi:hypothetical protein